MDYNGLLANLVLQVIKETKEFYTHVANESINETFKMKFLHQKLQKILALLKMIRSKKDESKISVKKVKRIRSNSQMLTKHKDTKEELYNKIDQIDNSFLEAQ